MAGADPVAVDQPVSAAEGAPDAVGGRAGGSVGWTSAVIAFAVAALLVFNAQSVRSWTETQPPGPLSLAARGVAESWWDATSRLGLTLPRSLIGGLWSAAQAARWPASRGAVTPACAAGATVGPASSVRTAVAGSAPSKRACEGLRRQR